MITNHCRYTDLAAHIKANLSCSQLIYIHQTLISVLEKLMRLLDRPPFHVLKSVIHLAFSFHQIWFINEDITNSVTPIRSDVLYLF